MSESAAQERRRGFAAAAAQVSEYEEEDARREVAPSPAAVPVVPADVREPAAAGLTATTALDGEPEPEPAQTRRERSSAALSSGAGEQMRRRQAARGWQGMVRRATFGTVTPAPSAAEVAEAADARAVRARFSGPKTVVVANPKGSAAKTPTVVGLAATFGDARGGNVLAWDNNETLGTLGLRVPAVEFPATAVDLLESMDAFERRQARRGDLARLVRPQESGNFHVLAADEDPSRTAQIDADAFGRLHQVLERYYDVLVIDTGNNPRAANFLAALDVADALVIPLGWAEDKVITAGRLIDQLRQLGHGSLVERAITVVSGQPGTQSTPQQIAAWSAWFTEQTSAVVTVPWDRHIAGGGPITYSTLRPVTRRAYLTAAAAVAQQFTAADHTATTEGEH